jgi:hypothetical protein
VIDLSRLGTSSAGVWTRAAALELLTADRIEGLLAGGTWVRVLPGVYADGGCALSDVQWAFAAALASGLPGTSPDRDGPASSLRAVPCARTAARVWGIPLIDDDDPATRAQDRVNHDVSVWRQVHPLAFTVGEENQTLRRHRLDPRDSDLVRHESGLWLTSRERTLFDLARFVTLQALVCAIDHQLHDALVTRGDLERLALALRHKRGAGRFARAVALADGRAESPAETLGRLLLQPVLPGLTPQVPVFDRAAREVARFDLADEELRLAVETDGKAGHAGSAMAAKDHARDRRTAGLGWHTERVTWFELRRNPQAVVRRVAAAAERLRAGQRPVNAR